MDDLVTVACIALPDGKTLWIGNHTAEYINRVFEKWKSENPEYMNTGCSSGAVVIKMPSKQYDEAFERNDFEFPEVEPWNGQGAG